MEGEERAGWAGRQGEGDRDYVQRVNADGIGRVDGSRTWFLSGRAAP